MKVAMCLDCVPPRALAAGNLNENALPHHHARGGEHRKVILVEKDRQPGEKAVAFLRRAEREWKASK